MLRKLMLSVACVAFAVVAAGDNERLVNDREVRYQGEELKEETVAMSCRMGAWVEEWASKGIFKNEDYVLFTTKDEGVEVLVAKSRKGLWDALRQQKAGTEVTLFGKVHWAKGIEPYLVIHEWKKGFSQAYEPKKPVAETIVLTFGGKSYDMERGKSYTLVTPKGEKVEAKWEEK
ncbi:MAG: hypothetical protein FD180_4556 [Planctomycetota bacterium]|nr:MAG: hypothetical protein FD180_4556 [Planctomycetota bacterium]